MAGNPDPTAETADILSLSAAQKAAQSDKAGSSETSPPPSPQAQPLADGAKGRGPEASSDVGPYEAKFFRELEQLLQQAPTSEPGSREGASPPWYLAIVRMLSHAVGDVAGVPISGLIGSSKIASPPISRLMILSRKLADAESSESFYREAYFAVLLLSKTTDVTAVEAVLDDLEYAAFRNSPIRTVVHGVRHISLWTIGVAATATVAYFAYAFFFDPPWYANVVTKYFAFLTSPLVVSALAGMMGSIVSILLRLGDFEGPTRKSQQFLQMTGMMLPVVGAAFAVVTGAMFASDIIHLDLGAGGTSLTGAKATPYVFLVLGFLSGFSERFTRGMLQKIETIAAGNGSKPSASGS